MTLTEPIARDAVPHTVSEQDYLDHWAERHYEWVDGELIALSPIKLVHHNQVDYLRDLLRAYFSLRPIGILLGEPFILRLDARHYREPDLMIVLHENSAGTLTDTAVIGAADVCIEIVSPESVKRDYVLKRDAYQRAGVREYWIIDPERTTAVFNRLDADGRYSVIEPDAAEDYTMPLLPGLRVHVPTMWAQPLPSLMQVVEAVQAMLRESTS